MIRLILRMLPLCLLLGCDAGTGDHFYDINSPLLRPDPATVRLPYEDALDKGGLRVNVQAIPGRADAVQVKARISGFYENPSVEWTQEGCSVKSLPFDRGLDRYDIAFLEMHVADGTVSEVKLSIVYRAKSGPR